jgi:hypothetical protein
MINALVPMQYLPIRHALDAMHIQRNISNNMLKHVFGEKDTPVVRRDMEAVGKFRHLHLQEIAGTNNFYQPKAPYVFTDQEKQEFLTLVSGTRVPSGCRHAGESRLAGLKSHDHHCLLQQILPKTVRNMLDRGVRETIIKVGHLFQLIQRLSSSSASLQRLFAYWN